MLRACFGFFVLLVASTCLASPYSADCRLVAALWRDLERSCFLCDQELKFDTQKLMNYWNYEGQRVFLMTCMCPYYILNIRLLFLIWKGNLRFKICKFVQTWYLHKIKPIWWFPWLYMLLFQVKYKNDIPFVDWIKATTPMGLSTVAFDENRQIQQS